jgi:hypothetical protein
MWFDADEWQTAAPQHYPPVNRDGILSTGAYPNTAPVAKDFESEA